MEKKAYLVLEDGTVFEGYSFGAQKDAIGELVFTTGMCGYIETLTDESYFGQIVLQTFPMIGNYGIIPEDFELSYWTIEDIYKVIDCEKIINEINKLSQNGHEY